MSKPKNIFVEGAISAPFIADCIAKHSRRLNIGAHSLFLGQVRADQKGEGVVEAIEYTSYIEMALEKAFEIREKTFSKFDLICMHLYHSLGIVKAGEVSLFVFTSAKHRDVAIEACEFVVELVKESLPVWGSEICNTKKRIWKHSN